MKILDWGRISYQDATIQQLQIVEALAASNQDPSEDVLVFCSHLPVVTVGRGTKPSDIFGWKGEILETSRGGRATYHGPSQLVAYPILNLSRTGRRHFAERDLHGYLRALENALVETLREFQIAAEARAVKADEDSPSLTGVWVGEKKIASIGIAVKKWITYHGLALNVTHDPLAFSGIHPCGFRSEVMTSIEKSDRHLLVEGARQPLKIITISEVQAVLSRKIQFFCS